MIILKAKPCQEITDFAAIMVAEAWRSNDVVLGEFNQFTLEARPGMMREAVMREWNEFQRMSYFWHGPKKDA